MGGEPFSWGSRGAVSPWPGVGLKPHPRSAGVEPRRRQWLNAASLKGSAINVTVFPLKSSVTPSGCTIDSDSVFLRWKNFSPNVGSRSPMKRSVNDVRSLGQTMCASSKIDKDAWGIRGTSTKFLSPFHAGTTISGVPVDPDGDMIDILVQRRRNQKAAERFFRRLLKSQGSEPRWLLSDKLASYDAAHRTVIPPIDYINYVYANNRSELFMIRHFRQFSGLIKPSIDCYMAVFTQIMCPLPVLRA